MYEKSKTNKKRICRCGARYGGRGSGDREAACYHDVRKNIWHENT